MMAVSSQTAAPNRARPGAIMRSPAAEACAVDQSLCGRRVDTGAAAFPGQVEARPLWIARVPCRGLE